MIAKDEVARFWNDASCGEKLPLESDTAEGYAAQALARYTLEPEIEEFAEFGKYCEQRVLEIGVGLGADHHRFAENGAIVTGIDLTERAINYSKHRFQVFGLKSELATGDAEDLKFLDDSFDLVYSWSVIHHSPDAPQVVRESTVCSSLVVELKS